MLLKFWSPFLDQGWYVCSISPMLTVRWQLLKACVEKDSEAQSKMLINDLNSHSES